jgi:cytochrome b6-f complex iron-sulfur subunit
MFQNTRTGSRISRRQFLGLSWAASLLGLFGQAGWALLRFFKPRVKPGGFGSRVVAGRVEEFPPGSITHIQAGDFYISSVEGAGLLAMWHRCTHLGCTVPWRDDMDHFHCPCHSSIYNRVGEVLGGPAPRPLDLFPIEIVDGEVVVDTERATQRKAFDPSQATKV